jgi:uroporphyrin-III C-methyltransferase
MALRGRRGDREGRLVVIDGAGHGARAPGKVWLVGAGPGDPELLTLKAARVLGAAEVVVHDRLVSDGVLALAPGARLIHVGKRKSRHSVPQDGINQLLVALALEGRQVVRLKGGDPFVFGRGGEELEACRAAGVACEVIPGITAGLAAAASVGAPVTHRGLAQAVTFLTGHAAPQGDGQYGEPEHDWSVLSRPNHTLVVYMGLSTAPVIAEKLIAAGRAPATPAVIVENASLPQERRIATRLDRLATDTAALDGPAVLIIGETAALADVWGLAEAGLPVQETAPITKGNKRT